MYGMGRQTCMHTHVRTIAHMQPKRTRRNEWVQMPVQMLYTEYMCQVTAVTSYMLLDVRMPLLSALGYINTNVAILIYYS